MERQDEQLSTRDLAGTPDERPLDDDAPAAHRAPAEPVEPGEPVTGMPAQRSPEPAPTGERAAMDADRAREPDDRVAATGGDGTVAAPADDPAGGVTTAEPSPPPRAETADRPSRASEDIDPELLPEDERSGFQRRWEEIQTGFIDEPRQTVEEADELVANVMKRLAEGFAQEREQLEQQWGRGEDISTEDLRVALQRYRSFFKRLLSA